MTQVDLRIIKGSHSFCVDKLTPRGKEVIKRFIPRFAQFTWVNHQGQYVKEIDAYYASSADEKREYRFHINVLADFEAMIADMHYDLDRIERADMPVYEPVKTNFELQDFWKTAAKPEQVPLIDYLANEKQVSRFLGLQTGQGKAQTLDSLIKIPGGWKTMGEMKVGDKVIARDGSTTNVLGVFPQGEVPIYRVTFSDGRSVEVCQDHLWRVYYVNTSVRQRWRTVNTLEMLRLISMPNPRVYVPLCEPEQDEDVHLPIDPYVLGAILGDGSFAGTGVKFTKYDTFILDELRKALPDSMQLVSQTDLEHSLKASKPGIGNPFYQILTGFGLTKCRSWEKFIPEIYTKASSRQRLALLQGLMDTDDTAQVSGTSSFCSTSHQLALAVTYLVRSLGGIASISERNPTYTYKGEKLRGRVAYQVNIRMKKPSDLFRLPRKKDRCIDDGQYNNSLKLRVSKIEAVGNKPAQCISVEHPEHLYITNDFIVTHNTACATIALARIQQRVVIIVQPKFMVKWQLDLMKMYKVTEKDIIHVRGGEDLRALISMSKEGRLDVPFIIISSKTFQNYITEYEDKGSAMLEQGWDAVPPHFFQAVGAGQRLIDEVHMEFHLMFKIDLFTNIPGSISLSATLISDKPFMERMYEIMFPRALRCPVPALIKYANAFAVHAMFDRVDKIRTVERGGRGYYSHNALERSIYNNKKVLANYLKFITWMVNDSFTHIKREKKSLIIFASTVEMCTIIRDHMREQFPKLRVERFVGTLNDPYENLMEADIKVSTLGKAGTAHDIPNLTNVILTICVNSVQSNVQSLGRLRQLEPGNTVFQYVVYDDIPKSVEYHKAKVEMLNERALTFNNVFSGFIL